MTMATVPKGTVQGKTWSYTDESMMGGCTRIGPKRKPASAHPFLTSA